MTRIRAALLHGARAPCRSLAIAAGSVTTSTIFIRAALGADRHIDGEDPGKTAAPRGRGRGWRSCAWGSAGARPGRGARHRRASCPRRTSTSSAPTPADPGLSSLQTTPASTRPFGRSSPGARCAGSIAERPSSPGATRRSSINEQGQRWPARDCLLPPPSSRARCYLRATRVNAQKVGLNLPECRSSWPVLRANRRSHHTRPIILASVARIAHRVSQYNLVLGYFLEISASEVLTSGTLPLHHAHTPESQRFQEPG